MSEFLPLRKKLRRAETGKEDNFVPPYLPESLAAAGIVSRASPLPHGGKGLVN